MRQAGKLVTKRAGAQGCRVPQQVLVPFVGEPVCDDGSALRCDSLVSGQAGQNTSQRQLWRNENRLAAAGPSAKRGPENDELGVRCGTGLGEADWLTELIHRCAVLAHALLVHVRGSGRPYR